MAIGRFKKLVLGTNLTGTDNGDDSITLDATGGGGGSVASDAIWDAKGDLAAASGADAADNLPVGSNDQVLVADSAQTLGVKWAALPGGAYVPVGTIDAKGDLLVGSANDAIDNLTVGSNNQVLTADSAQTLGVKWATPATGAVATDAIWDTKGDLAAATGADAASKLAVGSNDQVLTADSAQSTGLKWATPSAGAAGALTLLSTTTLGGSGTFDVSSISGAYNDLILVVIARGTRTSAAETLQLNFNNDSAGNYYKENLRANTTSATAAEARATIGLLTGRCPGSTGSLANSFGAMEVIIYGYASTTWIKEVLYTTHGLYATTSSSSDYEAGGGTWNNTAAINRVQIVGGTTANLVTGSQLRIYGRL